MKGKRYTTEAKVQLFSGGGSWREEHSTVVSGGERAGGAVYRWKKQVGQSEVNEARRLKELERENHELKKMLVDSLLKNRVLEAECEKVVSPAYGRAAAHPVVGPSRSHVI